MKIPKEINQQACRIYRSFSWRFIGKMILLLTTTGRISGLPRTTPLQYEKMKGNYYLGSANGENSDWVRNLLIDPRVKLRVGKAEFAGTAEVIRDREQLADFLAYRLRRHPIMLPLIFKMDGVSARPDRQELLAYAERLVLVVIHPILSEILA